MRKVAIYIRVSTDEQRDQGLSIPAQRQALIKYCEENGHTNIEEYIDEGISAGAMKKRKAMQRLLDDCRNGQIDLILFTKLDRWFRHVSKYHVIQEELNQLQVPWRAIHEPMYETVTAMGRTNINFYLTMAQGEIERTSERVRAVIQYKVSQGHALTGNLPLGYKIGDDKRPVIDPETVEAARFVLTEYKNIRSIRQICIMANERFGVNLTCKSVSNILTNKRYTGLYRGNPDYFPKLITLAEYDTNQDVVDKNIKYRPTKKGGCRVYLFTGILRCKLCKRKMASNACGYNVQNYRCPKHRANKSCPNNHATNENILEKNLLARLQEDLKNHKLQMEKKPIVEDKPWIDVDALKEEQKRLNKLYMKGRLDDDEYEEECERLDALLSHAAVSQPTPSMELALLPDFDELYASFTREEKRNFWHDILDRVEILGREFEPFFLA